MQQKTLVDFFPIPTSKALIKVIGSWLDSDESRRVKDIYSKMQISKQAFYQFLHPKRTLKPKTLEAIRAAMGIDRGEFYKHFGLKIED